MVEPASPSAKAASAAPEPERIPLPIVLSWGAPVVGASAGLFFVQFFFLNFATDVLLMAPAIVGVIFALGRLWDAVSDPMVGNLSDRTTLEIGRRKFWLFLSAPLLCVFGIMIWAPPAGLEGPWLIAWITVATLGFYTAYTVFEVPHMALGAELSFDGQQRNVIFGNALTLYKFERHRLIHR